MLEVDSISVSLGGKPILQQVSVQVQAGEVVALIGPNGAGKSTLVRAISGALPLSFGRVYVGGEDLRRLSPARRARLLAVVPQARQAPGPFSVYQTVLLGRTAYMNWLGQPGESDRGRVRLALERTQTLSLSERLVGELSGGEQQRVLLARALAQDAPLLLLDEPTTHLDLQHQSGLLNLVRQLARRHNLAVFMALHDLNLASLYADRVAILEQGRVLAVGTPAEVLTARTLSAVYHVPVNVITHPDYGTPLVLPDGRQ